MAKARAKSSSPIADDQAAGLATIAPNKPATRKAAPKSPSKIAVQTEGGTGRQLVIVESPAKAKTINKYLGDGYVVKASMGHVRDLPRSGMGIDLETFEPDYVMIEERGKDKVVSELRKLAKASPTVWLATDLDREGEAIAWHLKEALGVSDARAQRVVFNAITKTEIQKAFTTPRKLDMDRVNAQQARRILDRIVGYEISPLLWRKVAKGLSAGRVQSVAVRLVVEREQEIEKFVPAEYWKIGGVFTAERDAAKAKAIADGWATLLAREAKEGEKGGPTKVERERWLAAHEAFVAELVEIAGKKFEPTNKDEARQAAELLGYVVSKVETTEDADEKGPARFNTTILGRIGTPPPFNVRSIEKKRTTSRPPPPFITSTLQQSASSRLSLGAQRTMRLAQTLYEQGHITYMRTDSTNLSGEALNMVRSYIGKEFGDKYLPEKPNFFASSNKNAQEAHEAIRPTDVTLTPTAARAKLPPDEAKLYQLIWSRFVACQMPPAEFDQTSVVIIANCQSPIANSDADPNRQLAIGNRQSTEVLFRATGRKLVFDGFMKVAGISSEDQLLPELAEKQPVTPIDFNPSQHFTQPPPRFTEASLVKELERLGIGRPSTYASIIQTIQDRQYVVQQERRFYATLLGRVVTEKLIQAFPEIMDVGFTAGMELKLDQVEEQHLDWIKLLKDFYGPFHEVVAGSLEKIEHAGGAVSPYMCPKCGKPMLYRISKTGFFLACSDRECATTQPVDAQGKPTLREKSEFTCPKCGREMIKRKGRFGEFLGCSGYSVKNEAGEPSCNVIINLDKEGKPLPPKAPPIKTTVACEKCGSPMLLRDSKRGPFLGCSTFPKCRSTKMMKKLVGADLAQVEALIPLLKEESGKAAELAAKITGSMPAAPGAKTGPIATDIDCDDCGKPMIIRQGRRGPFLGCSGYPKCKNTGEVPAKLLEEMGIGADGKPINADGDSKAPASTVVVEDTSEDVPEEAGA